MPVEERNEYRYLVGFKNMETMMQKIKITHTQTHKDHIDSNRQIKELRAKRLAVMSADVRLLCGTLPELLAFLIPVSL